MKLTNDEKALLRMADELEKREPVPAPSERHNKNYSNPTTLRTITDWPHGAHKTVAQFYVETHPRRGQRVCRTTRDPKTGRVSKPKATTYHKAARIVDGDDGRTYILADCAPYGHLSVTQGNLQFTEESIHEGDPRHAELLKLLA